MLLMLIGAVVLAVAVVGTIMGVFRLTGRRAPRWILPTCAGAAVLGFILWSDYSWYRRTADALPPHIEVAAAYGSSRAWRPWTLIMPPVERFIALDTSSIKTNPRREGYVMATIYLLARYQPASEVTQLYDCTRPRRIDVDRSTTFDARGLPQGEAWVPVDEDHAVRVIACREAAG